MDILPDISVVIPAYNEEKRLPKYLDRLIEYFERKGVSFQIIVVDDGSSDTTPLIVNIYAQTYDAIQLIMLPVNSGKGNAVKNGMLMATGKLILFTDADGATPIEELDILQEVINQGADVVIASRSLPSDTCVRHTKLHRKIMGSVFNGIVWAVTGLDFHDTQCGFKLFTAEAAKTIFPLQSITGFGFDVEILFLCRMKKYLIFEVPVNWTDIPKSKVKLFLDSYRMFVDIIKVRRNEICGKYNVNSKIDNGTAP